MSQINNGLYTSASSEWRTPPELFERCNDRWGPFTLDAAASPENALCAPFFTTERSAFDYPWNASNGLVWMNPPYGREIKDWVYRAWEQVVLDNASRVVALLPARTDTRWWQDYCTGPLVTVHFLRGRVKFLDAQGNQQQSAPFPSAVVVFERPF